MLLRFLVAARWALLFFLVGTAQMLQPLPCLV